MKKKSNVAIQEAQGEKAVESGEVSARIQQTKKSLLERYKYMVVLAIIYLVGMAFFCISRAYDDYTAQFGDGPVNYTDDAYGIIKIALEGGTLRRDVTENILGQEKTAKILEEYPAEKIPEENEKEVIEIYVDPCLIENIGLDIKRFGLFVTDFELHTKTNYQKSSLF